jgi:hypothetical protein
MPRLQQGDSGRRKAGGWNETCFMVFIEIIIFINEASEYPRR